MDQEINAATAVLQSIENTLKDVVAQLKLLTDHIGKKTPVDVTGIIKVQS